MRSQKRIVTIRFSTRFIVTILNGATCLSLMPVISTAGTYPIGSIRDPNHRYSIKGNQYVPTPPHPNAPHYGFFAKHWRRWPGHWADAQPIPARRGGPEDESGAEPEELPQESAGDGGPTLESIEIPSPDDIQVEGEGEQGPPAPPVKLQTEEGESPAEPFAPPSLDTPTEQTPTETADPPAAAPDATAPEANLPDQPQLPPELRDTLPEPQQPGEELPTPTEAEPTPPGEPNGTMGRVDGPRMLSESSDQRWRPRGSRSRAAVAGRQQRASRRTYSDAREQSAPELFAPESSRPLVASGSRVTDMQEGPLLVSTPETAVRTVRQTRTRPTIASRNQVDHRQSSRASSNPLRGGEATAISRVTVQEERALYNPLRDGRRAR